MARWWILLCASLALCSASVRGDALADAGLSKVGSYYLLDLDQHLNDRLKQITSAEQQNQALARKRAALQADTAQANAEIADLQAKVADLEDRRSRISEKAHDSRKFLEDQAKALGTQIQADQQRIEKNKSESASLKSVDVGAVSSKLADEMDAAADKYAQLAKDPAIASALAAASNGGAKMKLGPSALFAQQLPRLRVARDKIRSSATEIKKADDVSAPAPAASPAPAGSEATLRINLSVDAHETIEIDKTGLRLIHDSGPLPTGIIVNGTPWDLSTGTTLPISTSTAFLATSNLAAAHIVEKTGRDTCTLTANADGVKLQIADSHPGAGDYSVTIGFPAK